MLKSIFTTKRRKWSHLTHKVPMKDGESEKPNIRDQCWCHVRDNCCNIGGFFRKWYCLYLTKVTGSECEELKPLTHCIALLCFCLLSFGLVTPIGLYIYSYFSGTSEDSSTELFSEAQDTTQTASVVSAIGTDIDIDVPADNDHDVFPGCDLSAGEWIRWFGKINQDFDDKTHFTLPVSSGGALFKYIGKIDDFSSCEFIFIPTSESSINYVISLDEIYQIVIGDNDLWTVALRATDAIGGELLPISEDATQKTRPRLLSAVKSGTTVRAAINQGFIDSGRYKIELTVTYKPDATEINETQTSKFMWTFEPSPAILENPSLSVGLIRGFGDKSEIGVKFVNPDVVQEHNE